MCKMGVTIVSADLQQIAKVLAQLDADAEVYSEIGDTESFRNVRATETVMRKLAREAGYDIAELDRLAANIDADMWCH